MDCRKATRRRQHARPQDVPLYSWLLILAGGRLSHVPVWLPDVGDSGRLLDTIRSRTVGSGRTIDARSSEAPASRDLALVPQER